MTEKHKRYDSVIKLNARQQNDYIYARSRCNANAKIEEMNKNANNKNAVKTSMSKNIRRRRNKSQCIPSGVYPV